MNKSELIEHIAKQADISKAAATRALEAVIGGVKTTLKKGGSVSLVGFGTFTSFLAPPITRLFLSFRFPIFRSPYPDGRWSRFPR